MSDESVIWQAAETLIDRFGDAAVEQAEMRARELHASHNFEASAFWTAVRHATEALLRRRSTPSLH